MTSACFWSGWDPATMHFCEQLRCGVIVQPANTFSSLAFVAVGLYLLRVERPRSVYALFPIAAVLVGVTSFLYHASMTFFFQVFDLSSMFMLSCLLLSFNARRLGLVSTRALPRLYAGLVVASVAALLFFRGRSGEWLFGAEVVAALASEAVLWRARPGTRYADFAWTLGTFLLAFLFWTLDARGVVCDPGNHYLQGHAVWHVLDSFCYYFLYRFYLQFAPELAGPS